LSAAAKRYCINGPVSWRLIALTDRLFARRENSYSGPALTAPTLFGNSCASSIMVPRRSRGWNANSSWHASSWDNDSHRHLDQLDFVDLELGHRLHGGLNFYPMPTDGHLIFLHKPTDRGLDFYPKPWDSGVNFYP
jgi:hypothetical protein